MKLLYACGIVWLCLMINACSSNVAEELVPDAANNAGALFQVLPASQTGINFTNRIIREDTALNCFSFFNIYNGGGVATGDINNDGLPDIYFTGNQVPNKLYLNKGNMQFEDITEKAGVAGDDGWTTGVTMADVNGDGFIDIYVCRSGTRYGSPDKRKNLLYINNGDQTFTDQGAQMGIADDARSNHAAFFDYDNDGDLDLYVLNHPKDFGLLLQYRLQKEQDPQDEETDKLFRNDGAAGFVEVTDKAGVRNYGFGLSVTPTDYNNDGWVDLFVANDYSEPDHLYINNGNGTFTDQIHEAMPHISQFSMGADAADFNNDGFMDLLVVDMMAEDNRRKKTNMQGMNPQAFYNNVALGRHFQYMQNMLHMNNGNGTYSDIAEYAGVAYTDWSWSPLFFDMDNDGLKDIYITNGMRRDIRNNDFQKIVDKYTPEYTYEHHAELTSQIPVEPVKNYGYQNAGNLRFEKISQEWGLGYEGFSNGSAYADLDLDGDLDLVVNNLEAVSQVIENQSAEANYLRVKLDGTNGNPFGLGARVMVKTDQGEQYAELTANHGFLSSSEPIVHFGLGATETVLELTVVWPGGATKTYTNVAGNQLLALNQEEATDIWSYDQTSTTIFNDYTSQSGVNYTHKETYYDDFEREVLLPHRYSQNGPTIATGDVNGDGLEDFFVGGAHLYSGELFVQTASGTFKSSTSQPWQAHMAYEDMGSTLFDADNDGDLDLYVASGSNEWDVNSGNYQDRLYINDGSGNFQYDSSRLPIIANSAECVEPGDFDGDGDLDLFVGGRIVPGLYPYPANSMLLQNEDGYFTDVTQQLAPDFYELGLVTDAVWSDYDGDQDLDIIITGEWMPITVMQNDGGAFVNQTAQSGLEYYTGWWYSIEAGDFDNDGDEDYIVGNLGENSKYQTTDGPVEVFSKDVDQNGINDIILSYHAQGELFPLRGRTCSSQQVPDILNQFETYEEFGSADVFDIYGTALEGALNYKANWLKTSYVKNEGAGQLTVQELPALAQLSAVTSLCVYDVNEDGHQDVVLGGNMWQAEVETCKHDASYGLVLLGDGAGNFNIVTSLQSGLRASGDVKDMKIVESASSFWLLVARNNTSIKLYKSANAAQ